NRSRRTCRQRPRSRALSGGLEVDLELDLAAEGHRLLVRPATLHELETLDERFRDALARDLDRLLEEVLRQVCRHALDADHDHDTNRIGRIRRDWRCGSILGRRSLASI